MPRHVREPQRAGIPQNEAITTVRVWSIWSINVSPPTGINALGV